MQGGNTGISDFGQIKTTPPLIVGGIAFYTGEYSSDAPTNPDETFTPAFFFGGDGSIGYNPGTGWAVPTLGDVSDWPHWG